MVLIIWICWEDIKMLWVKGLSSFTYLFTYMWTCMFVSGCVHVGARRGCCVPSSITLHSFLWAGSLPEPGAWAFSVSWTGNQQTPVIGLSPSPSELGLQAFYRDAWFVLWDLSSTPHSCEAGLFTPRPPPQPYTFLTIWKERQILTQVIGSM